ncbi:DeoR/GlpR family DNA-binding transcription regulator [Lichenihabitans sp. PAMC28606]|uniref:DeoR/GlpR family DNA-binding transcription regulator n=1 Tax=Lichenihabitans sp. PAMC28606 TaxID=2880932 RepID=UPI001D09E471|nr:DeoR/GlpR family DNA-binding transcription regulator [Lichenihabitans sp. PAMC28606]UDL93394.1 DeoR/GlpR family DNA-binding transcription regulator [Lichenihabitans sp. PAMC28606]
MKPDRLEALRHHLYAQGTCSIEELASATGASVATIRRDLTTLEQQGIVSRTHGGARIAAGAQIEVAFSVRERQQLAEKRAIAAKAYDLIRPQSSVFLDAGTTVLQLARRLRVSPMPLTIFTNGLMVAQELMNVPQLRVTLLGGQLRSENASLVGPAAEAMLDRLWFDQLFLGASAIGDDGGIYSVDASEASLNDRMMERSAAVTVLADASKFGRRTTYLVAMLAPPMRVISDKQLAAARQRRLREAGVDLVIAPDTLGPTPSAPTP